MSYSSIRFTEKNHKEIEKLFDYDDLNERKLNESLNKLKRFLEKDEAPRYLYVIRCGNSNRYKIGITNNIAKRIKSHQTGNPFPLKLIFQVEADLSDFLGREIIYLEKFLHDNYQHLKVLGEWFKFSKKLLSDMCNFLVNNRDLELLHDDPEELSIYHDRLKRILTKEGFIDKDGNDID